MSAKAKLERRRKQRAEHRQRDAEFAAEAAKFDTVVDELEVPGEDVQESSAAPHSESAHPAPDPPPPPLQVEDEEVGF